MERSEIRERPMADAAESPLVIPAERAAREPGSICPDGDGKHAESHPHHWGIWIPDRLAWRCAPLAVRDDSRVGCGAGAMTAEVVAASASLWLLLHQPPEEH